MGISDSGWLGESNAKYMAESKMLEGGNLDLDWGESHGAPSTVCNSSSCAVAVFCAPLSAQTKSLGVVRLLMPLTTTIFYLN